MHPSPDGAATTRAVAALGRLTKESSDAKTPGTNNLVVHHMVWQPEQPWRACLERLNISFLFPRSFIGGNAPPYRRVRVEHLRPPRKCYSFPTAWTGRFEVVSSCSPSSGKMPWRLDPTAMVEQAYCRSLQAVVSTLIKTYVVGINTQWTRPVQPLAPYATQKSERNSR